VSGVLIVNLFASGVSEERLAAVEAALPRELEVVSTRGPGHATTLARELDGAVDAIYVFSGDGTYNEVLNGVSGTRSALGFVPGGGTSVLPRALGLPRDPGRAAARLALGRSRRIGLGRANGRRFGFNAGLGLDAELVRRVDALGRSSDGRRPGEAAFAREAVRLLAAHRFRLEPALELVGIGRAAFAFVANCCPYTYAGPLGLRFAPAAGFDAGLDVFAPPRVGPLGIPAVAWWALGLGRRHVRGHDLARLEVVCDAPTALQLDGEDLGDVTRCLLESEPDAVTVLV
jgi:diacylglycerol kinase family enzyme